MLEQDFVKFRLNDRGIGYINRHEVAAVYRRPGMQPGVVTIELKSGAKYGVLEQSCETALLSLHTGTTVWPPVEDEEDPI